MNTLVNFELAKSLNYKGLPGLKSFYDDKKQYELNPKKYTIAEVVMWLYEKHGIWVSVKTIKWNYEHNTIRFNYNICKFNHNNSSDITDVVYDFNSPTEAYEAAIEYTLKNLI